jgi:predicted AAA+ superfamily ATPase
MFPRPFWQRRIADAWTRRSIVWLTGVRRVGKSVLCRSLAGVDYLDCELPRTRRLLDDPESFLDERRTRAIALDEIHRLTNPVEVLKIAADHFPKVRIIATGSSTLGASARFRDTLTGRKEEIWLTPMTLADLDAFGNRDLRHRLRAGGLPPFFLARPVDERDYQEWLDAYWAKDILELFRLERRHSFQRLFELLLAQSGGIFEATALARPTEMSRTTVMNYLAVLEATFVVHVVRPFAERGAAEIVAAPKVYGFDTGFVAYHRGWDDLKGAELGQLWEHFVLNELHAHVGRSRVHYWRSKHGNEVDFVLPAVAPGPMVVECKWSVGDFDPAGIQAFRRRYPRGRNLVVTADRTPPFTKRYGDIAVRFVSLPALIEALRPSARRL